MRSNLTWPLSPGCYDGVHHPDTVGGEESVVGLRAVSGKGMHDVSPGRRGIPHVMLRRGRERRKGYVFSKNDEKTKRYAKNSHKQTKDCTNKKTNKYDCKP